MSVTLSQYLNHKLKLWDTLHHLTIQLTYNYLKTIVSYLLYFTLFYFNLMEYLFFVWCLLCDSQLGLRGCSSSAVHLRLFIFCSSSAVQRLEDFRGQGTGASTTDGAAAATTSCLADRLAKQRASQEPAHSNSRTQIQTRARFQAQTQFQAQARSARSTRPAQSQHCTARGWAATSSHARIVNSS